MNADASSAILHIQLTVLCLCISQVRKTFNPIRSVALSYQVNELQSQVASTWQTDSDHPNSRKANQYTRRHDVFYLLHLVGDLLRYQERQTFPGWDRLSRSAQVVR